MGVPQLRPEDAAADLDSVADLVRSVHPAPYRYVSATAFDEAHAAAREELLRAGSIDDIAAARAIQRLVSHVGDAHFAIALPSFQPGARTEPFLLPLLPKRARGRVFIDASLPEFPAGTELLALDGTPIDDLWAELAKLALVDGDRPAARAARVERDFTLHFHVARGTKSSYGARVRYPDGAEQVVELPAAAREAIGALRQARHSAPVWGPASPPPPMPEFSTAAGYQTVRLQSFGAPDPQAYQRQVDMVMREIDRDVPLVFDLRGNPGGMRTNGVAALNHVIPGPYAQWLSMTVRVRQIPARLRPQISFPFTAPDTLSKFPGEERNGDWRFEGDPLAGAMTGTREPFASPIAVLIDDATNSAANEMIAALLAARPDTTLIGTETIGECGRHIGEVPVMFTGKTGVRVLMSTVAIEHVPTRDCAAGRGFVPDVPIDYSEDDFMNGRDPYLAALEAWVAGRD